MTPRQTNAPYEPVHHPDLSEPWRGYLAAFLRFCEQATIFSKEIGVTRLILLGSQRYLVEMIFWGLAQGRHDFIVVKARQLGVSSVLWALDLWWLMKFPGMQAFYIADEEATTEDHRGSIEGMYASLPRSLSRGKPKVANRREFRWSDQVSRKTGRRWNASRLRWAFANRRNEGRLAIGRGVNVVHGTEIDTWGDREGVAAMHASLADRHPRRLYVWEGTGRNFGLLYEFWTQAETSTTTARVFVAFWRREDYVVTRDERAKWRVYGAPPAEPHELEWAKEVKRRFGHAITREQVAFWRWKKAEGKGIDGDEAKALEQYPWLPEHAFQAAGSQFLASMAMIRVRRDVEAAPPAESFRVHWGGAFDAKDDPRVAVPAEIATLTIWEEKQPGALYVVAGDPSYGASEDSDHFAVTVWRTYPDKLVQVAEYHTPDGTMYEFAWLLAYLAGYYEKWLIYDINGPGVAVMQELKRMAERGHGLTRRAGRLQDAVGNIQHYLWTRPDAMSSSYSWGWKTGPNNQEQLMEQLRNEVERGAVVVRSATLRDQLAALRRDKSRIEAGGVAKMDLAVTAAMAVEYWLGAIQDEIDQVIAPEGAQAADPAEKLLSRFFVSMREPQDPAQEPRLWGLREIGPGR